MDLDLTHAGVQCVTSRQRLGIAARGVWDPLLRTLHKRLRRENLQRVAHIVKGAFACACVYTPCACLWSLRKDSCHGYLTLYASAYVRTAARTVLQLVKEARASAADGRLDRAVAAATEARLALDGEALKDAAMMVRVMASGDDDFSPHSTHCSTDHKPHAYRTASAKPSISSSRSCASKSTSASAASAAASWGARPSPRPTTPGLSGRTW